MPSHALTRPPGFTALQRETSGKKYYEFEFTAKTPRFTRHSLAVVTVNDGERGGDRGWSGRRAREGVGRGMGQNAGLEGPYMRGEGWF
jgi:hypothetical protein